MRLCNIWQLLCNYHGYHLECQRDRWGSRFPLSVCVCIQTDESARERARARAREREREREMPWLQHCAGVKEMDVKGEPAQETRKYRWAAASPPPKNNRLSNAWHANCSTSRVQKNIQNMKDKKKKNYQSPWSLWISVDLVLILPGCVSGCQGGRRERTPPQTLRTAASRALPCQEQPGPLHSKRHAERCAL